MSPPAFKIAAVEKFYFSDFILNGSFAPPGLLFRKLVLISYSVVAIVRMRKKIQEQEKWSSNTNLLYLRRFQFVAYLFTAYTFSSFIGLLYFQLQKVPVGYYEIYNHVVNSVIVVLLAAIAGQQPDAMIFSLQRERKNQNEKGKAKFNADDLDQLMIREKPYLNPELKLYGLATLTQTSPQVLSNLINQAFNMNFFEFVNHYRVEEFKDRVTSSNFSHLTLLAIAFDVGFNSKASFNRIFKKHTGVTPSQYLKDSKVSTS